MTSSPVQSLRVDQLSVEVYDDRSRMGAAAAAAVAERIHALLRSQSVIRMPGS